MLLSLYSKINKYYVFLNIMNLQQADSIKKEEPSWHFQASCSLANLITIQKSAYLLRIEQVSFLRKFSNFCIWWLSIPNTKQLCSVILSMHHRNYMVVLSRDFSIAILRDFVQIMYKYDAHYFLTIFPNNTNTYKFGSQLWSVIYHDKSLVVFSIYFFIAIPKFGKLRLTIILIYTITGLSVILKQDVFV